MATPSQPPASPPLEATLLVKREAQVFPLPPRTSAQGYKAAGWDTSKAWQGRVRILHVTYASPTHATAHLGPALGKPLVAKPPAGFPDKPWSVCVVKLEDATSGELFGEALIRDVESDVERVLDSSRYFVIKLVDRVSGRSAYAGFGFAERADAFDFNVALQDFAKAVRYELGMGGAESSGVAVGGTNTGHGQTVPALDMGLKEGQQIKLNIGGLAKKIGATSATTTAPPAASGPAPATSTGNLFFPPPPAPAPGGATSAAASDDPFAFAAFAAFDSSSAPTGSPGKRASGNEWADFAAAPAGPPAEVTSNAQAPQDNDPFAAFK